LAVVVATGVAVPVAAQVSAARDGRPVVSIVYTGRSLGALGVLRDADEHDLVIEAARAAGLTLRFSTWRGWRTSGLTVFAPERDLTREDLDAIVAARAAGFARRPALVSNNATLVQDPAGGATDLVALTRNAPRASRDFPDLVARTVRVGTVDAGAAGRLTVVAETDTAWPNDPAAWAEAEVNAITAGDATLWELPVNLAGAGPRATLVGEATAAARAAGARPILVDLGHRSGDLGLEPPDRARLDYYVLSTLGYQFVVPYELELGLGVAGLSGLHAEFPNIHFLAANVDASQAADLIERHAIVEIDGLRIGLVGLIDPQLEGVMSRGALADFSLGPPVPAAVREVAALRQAGVQAIVVLSNLHPRDNALVAREVAGIDAIVADLHVRWSPETIETDVALPGRPYVRPGSPALVARGFANGLGVGRLDLAFTGRGPAATLTSLHHELASATDRVPADRALVAEIRRRAALAERPRGPVLLPAFGALIARRPSLAEYDSTTALGRVSKRMWEEFLARLVRYRAGAEVAVIRKLPHFPPAVGALHEADVRAWLWTDDSIVLADVTGAELRSLLAGDREDDLRTSGIDLRAGTINGRRIASAVYYRVATTDVVFDGSRSGAFRGARRVARRFTVRADGRLKAANDDGAELPLRTFVLEQLARLHRAYEPADYEALMARLLDRDPTFEPLFTFMFDRPTLLGSLSRTANTDEYSQVPESRVRAADSFVLGVGGRYEVSFDRRRWGLDFGVDTEYTRQSGTRNGSHFDLENRDDLVFDVRARHKLARQGQHRPQPFMRVLYDTEFTPTTNPDTGRRNPRQKLLRGSGGLLFNPGHGWTYVELGAVLEGDLTTGRLRWGAQARTDLVMHFGPLGRLAYRWRNDATWFAPAAGDTAAELGLKYSMIHEVLIPLVDEFSLSVGADTYFFRGTVPETSRLGVSAIFRVGLTYERLWKPRYQPFF